MDLLECSAHVSVCLKRMCRLFSAQFFSTLIGWTRFSFDAVSTCQMPATKEFAILLMCKYYDSTAPRSSVQAITSAIFIENCSYFLDISIYQYNSKTFIIRPPLVSRKNDFNPGVVSLGSYNVDLM